MNRSDLSYYLMRKALLKGAQVLDKPYFIDEEFTAIGRYLIFSEKNSSWTNGSSMDPSIFQIFDKGFSGLESTCPSADEAYDYVEKYLLEQGPYFDTEKFDDDDVLVKIFEAGTSLEEWRSDYKELTRGLVSY